jgi:hypothetical protein
MQFHLGWSGPTRSSGHGGYNTEDGHYASVGHLQDRGASRQENQMVQNLKLDGPVSPKTVVALGHQRKYWVPKNRSSADGSGGSKD